MDINQIKDVVSIVSGDFDRIYAYSNLIVNFLRKRKRTIDSEINLSSALKEVGGFYQTVRFRRPSSFLKIAFGF